MSNIELKIALIGVSHWHTPLYLPGLPENSVVAVSDNDPNIAGSFAKKLGCRSYTDYRQLVKETKPDFVFAFAPHAEMMPLAMYLMGANIAFSIEKPAGLSGDEVKALYDYSIAHNSFCSIPFVWRYSDTVNDLKSKYLTGDIRHLSFKFIAGPPSRYLATSPWMLSGSLAGGGCMTNLGVHFIDMALFLTDSSSAEALTAIYHFDREYDIETYASSMLRLENGASLLLESGYAYPMSEDSKRENRWNIVTENGYYTLADNRLEIRRLGARPSYVSLNTDSDPYYAVYAERSISDFVNGVTPRASLKEMYATRRILDEINLKAR